MLYLSRTYATNKKPKWDVQSWVKCPSPLALSGVDRKNLLSKKRMLVVLRYMYVPPVVIVFL